MTFRRSPGAESITSEAMDGDNVDIWIGRWRVQYV